MENSDVGNEEMKSRMGSSNYAGSMLEEMCQEISDIKLGGEESKRRVSANEPGSLSQSGSKIFKTSLSKQVSETSGNRKTKKKSIDANHQNFLFHQYIDETDFQLQQRG